MSKFYSKICRNKELFSENIGCESGFCHVMYGHILTLLYKPGRVLLYNWFLWAVLVVNPDGAQAHRAQITALLQFAFQRRQRQPACPPGVHALQVGTGPGTAATAAGGDIVAVDGGAAGEETHHEVGDLGQGYHPGVDPRAGQPLRCEWVGCRLFLLTLLNSCQNKAGN